MTKNKSEPGKPCCLELAPLEKAALGHIFRSIIQSGNAATVDELRVYMDKSEKNVKGILDDLEKKDLLLRRKGTQNIVSIYPFSLRPTKHKVILEDGKRLFAMCAVDALGVPNMFKKDVKVISECARCGQKVTVEVKNQEIAAKSHPQIMIWNLEAREGTAAETCCPIINFFCSDDHFREWASDNNEVSRKGKGERLEQAYPDIKERWQRYGEEVGVR